MLSTVAYFFTEEVQIIGKSLSLRGMVFGCMISCKSYRAFMPLGASSL